MNTKTPSASDSGAQKHDIVDELREYAGNPGYSHGDYADTMRQAAKTIESLRAGIFHFNAITGGDWSRAAVPGDASDSGLNLEHLEAPTDNTKSWPARIWLQHGCDEVPDYAETRGVEDGITWCQDNIDALDVEYVRADLARRAAPVSAPIAEDDGTDWNGVIDLIADELEEKSNLGVISQFTSLCEKFDQLRAALANQPAPEVK